MEEKVYQGFIYRRAGPGQPWQQVGPAPAQRSRGRIYTDPTQAREQARKDETDRRANEDQDIQRERLGLSRDDEARSSRREAIDSPQVLRKEYSALPEVKAYKVAAQMTTAGLNTAANPQGDLALVYAFAKAMDPESVVRDQESQMVTNTQPWFQAMVQSAKKQFGMDGAGNFAPEARARLRQEIVRSLASRKPLYDARRAEFTELAQANGLEPRQIIGKSETEVYAPTLRKYAEINGDDGNVIASLIGEDSIDRVIPEGAPGKAAGAGATQGMTPIPPEMQAAHAEYIRSNWGKIDPQDYSAFRINLDKQYGFGSNPEAYAGAASELNADAARGGAPDRVYVPGVETTLSEVDKVRNNLISNPVGAGVAGGLNAAGFGLPSFFAPGQMQAVREEYPVSSFVGEVGGGIVGTGLAGIGLRGAASKMGYVPAVQGGAAAQGSTVARALANPMAADIGYGAAYGATQAEDPVYGALVGGGAGFLGNRAGAAIGRSFPGAAGTGRAIRAADQSVPSSQALKNEASSLYGQAEANGLVAQPPETLALADRVSSLLSREGRLSPTDRLTDVQPKVKEAYNLVQDYAGAAMTPKQIQTVRSVISDAGGSADAGERRVAKLLLREFDDWTDATNPALASGLKDARGVASRYIQGDDIARTREMAEVRAGQFSNSGQGNALRTDFRQLDRGIANGQESFAPAVEDAVREVARGTTVGNALRNVGRFAPTGAVSSIPMLLAMGGGHAAAGPLGAIGGLALGATAFGARQLGQRVTNRSAQVAENLAYGGDQYDVVLKALLDQAATRGGHAGTALTTSGARALADYTGN